jgi:hypothetical protein
MRELVLSVVVVVEQPLFVAVRVETSFTMPEVVAILTATT